MKYKSVLLTALLAVATICGGQLTAHFLSIQPVVFESSGDKCACTATMEGEVPDATTDPNLVESKPLVEKNDSGITGTVTLVLESVGHGRCTEPNCSDPRTCRWDFHVEIIDITVGNGVNDPDYFRAGTTDFPLTDTGSSWEVTTSSQSITAACGYPGIAKGTVRDANDALLGSLKFTGECADCEESGQ